MATVPLPGVSLMNLNSLWCSTALNVYFIVLITSLGSVFTAAEYHRNLCDFNPIINSTTVGFDIIHLNDSSGNDSQYKLTYASVENGVKVVRGQSRTGIVLNVLELSANTSRTTGSFYDDFDTSYGIPPYGMSYFNDDKTFFVHGYLYLKMCDTDGIPCSKYAVLKDFVNNPCSVSILDEVVALNLRGNAKIDIFSMDIEYSNPCVFVANASVFDFQYPRCATEVFDEIYEAPYNDTNSFIFNPSGVTELPSCPFDCTCRVEYLAFKRYCPDTPEEKVFIIYPNGLVTEISAGSRQIEHIEPGTFRDMHTIKILSLQNNQLSHLVNGTFQDLSSLEKLYLNDNTLLQLENGIFAGLDNLQELRLDNNSLQTIGKQVFHDLWYLKILGLSGNNLAALQPGLFRNWALRELYINKSNTESLVPGTFESLSDLIILDLSANNIRRIQNGTFAGMEDLEILSLQNNRIGDIDINGFVGLVNLGVLNIHSNRLQVLSLGVFKDCTRLIQLNAYNNQLNMIQPGALGSLSKLQQLNLHINNITHLNPGMFAGLEKLIRLRLSNNQISEVHADCFNNLESLRWLALDSNQLLELPPGVFVSLRSLESLRLARNNLLHFTADTFAVSPDCISNEHSSKINVEDFAFHSNLNDSIYPLMSSLDLTSNKLNNLDSCLFTVLPNLKHLRLNSNPMKRVLGTTFADLDNRTSVFVSEFFTCCFMEDSQCYSSNPKPPQLTCERLLHNFVLKVAMWILGLGALFGNMFVLLWRLFVKIKENAIQSFLIINLAISDLMMGIYMILITSADVYFGAYFPSEADMWRNGSICKFAGTLSILSSEASILFVTLISFDRLIAITRPFSTLRLGRISSKIVIVCLWTAALTLALLPSILSGNPNFYENSEVCIGLPLSRRNLYNSTTLEHRITFQDLDQSESTTDLEFSFSFSIYGGFFYYFDDSFFTSQQEDDEDSYFFDFQGNVNVVIGTIPGMYYSIALFLGVNFVCCVAIVVCYSVIFITVYKSGKRVKRNQQSSNEVRLAFKMAAIVFTDLFCWMPVIILGILVQSGAVSIAPVVYAWLVVFVLPINSSVNPFLYTIVTVVSEHKSKGKNLLINNKKQNSGPETDETSLR